MSGAPEQGQVRVGLVECEAALPTGANASVGDLMVSNSEGYAIFRMDSVSKYFLHVGGGGLLDMGLWGDRESLAEAVPLSDGRWIRGGSVDWGLDDLGAWVRVTGLGRPIHFLEAGQDEAQEVLFRWPLEGTTLRLEGADGLLFLGEEGGEVVEGAWEGGDSRFTMNGLQRDLGGAVRFDGDSLHLEKRAAEEEAEEEEPEEEAEGWVAEFDGAVGLVLNQDVYPSRRSRLTPEEALKLRSEEGVGLVVLAPVDEVGVAPDRKEDQARVIGGSLAEAPGLGRVVVWPVSAKSHKPAHGAAAWEGLGAEEVLSLAKNASSGRRAMVDSEWVDAAGAMANWSTLPELIWLESVADFHRVREAWETGTRIGFAGPMTWVPADTTALPSLAEIERGLLLQLSSASSGPMLLSERSPSGRMNWDVVRIRLEGVDGYDVDALEVWGSEGMIRAIDLSDSVAQWEGGVLVPASQDVWVVLDGADWAVSSVLSP